VRQADIMQSFADGKAGLTMDLTDILEKKSIGGQFTTEFQGRGVRPYAKGDVVTIGFSTGGTGYGDPLERDPESMVEDIEKGVVSDWTVKNIYKVVWDMDRRRVDAAATKERRADEYRARLKRGRPYDEFQKEWLKKNPPEEILGFYGSWPDAKVIAPVMRP